jgi:hypothetical protein
VLLTLNSRFVANKVRGIHFRSVFRSPNAAPASAGSAGDPGTGEPARLLGGLLWCGRSQSWRDGSAPARELLGSSLRIAAGEGHTNFEPVLHIRMEVFYAEPKLRKNAQNHATHKHVTFYHLPT